MLAQRTARIAGIDPNKVWNLCIVVLFTALIGSRILLIIANWSILRSHPIWMLGISMIHHPMLAAAGAALALLAAWIFVRSNRMPLRATSDVLSPPLALAVAFEQIGALLAGSGYGTGSHLPWAVIYSNPLAERWSGAPIGIPVHPVQAYTALAFFFIAVFLLLWLPKRRQHGDIAGIFLMSAGVVLFITEFWRDPIGRGAILGGFLKGPQATAVILVLTGAALLLERDSQRIAAVSSAAARSQQPASQETMHG